MIEEEKRELLELLPALMILLGDFNTHNPLWGSEKMCTRGRMIENILDRYNFLCINKKEAYYRAFDSSKSTIDLTNSSLTTASELERSKKYEFGGGRKCSLLSNHRRGKGSLHETTT